MKHLHFCKANKSDLELTNVNPVVLQCHLDRVTLRVEQGMETTHIWQKSKFYSKVNPGFQKSFCIYDMKEIAVQDEQR